jgi:hypothetical protein
MKFQKFVPLAKMEEQADGTLHVYGLVTEEKPDLDNEVCDYATTKPLYEKRTQERAELTSKIEGMTPSLMAMRGQHDVHQAIGAGRSIVCDDTAKAIKMGFHIVDSEAVKKWRGGVFVGFSQGGEYVAKWDDPVYKGCMRYTADPMEVSSVDAPSLPSALAESMKGRTVTLMKAAGTTEQVALVIPSQESRRLDKVEAAVDQIARMFKREFSDDERKKLADEGKAMPDGSFPIENEEDLKNAIQAYGRAKDKDAAKKHIVARAKALGLMRLIPEDWTKESDKVAITRACATIALKKGMYEVGWLADIVEGLNWLCLQSEFERDLEDDGSKVPDGLREAWLELLAQFKAMAIEEADEMAAAGGKGAKGMKITDQAGLTKAAKTIQDHLEKHMEMHKAHHEKLEGALAKDSPIVKSSQAMMDHCEKCMKAAKDAAGGDDGESEQDKADKVAKAAADAAAAAAAAADPVTKAITAALAPFVEKIDALEKKIATTPAAQVIPHSGAGQVEKGITADAAYGELLAK